MSSINLTNLRIERLITHHVGNKLREDGYQLSDEITSLNKETKNILLKHFLNPLKYDELYSFHHPVKLIQNDIYNIALNIFTDIENFIEYSQYIAELLYDSSMHPRIKEGELNIALLSNIEFDNQAYNAIGIFKSESSVPFIKMESKENKFQINHDYGFEINGMDKGCLIINNNTESGFRIMIGDKKNPDNDAQYWKEDFLKIEPINDDYYNTMQFLSSTKEFINKKIDANLSLNKVDKIDLLNRSVEYFKTHDQFDKQEFRKNVFRDDKLIKSFTDFQDSDLSHSDHFDISLTAVKKQSKRIKNVIKLDKNFHIYVHGDRKLIENGQDSNGRKYYKIYYESEN